MSVPYEKTAAIVYLPAVRGGRLRDSSLRRWLLRADLQLLAEPQELLASALGQLNLPYSEEGLGALRMWGQTGDRPTVWIAAADPVYLEPRLDHLCLHSLGRESVPINDLRPLFDHLQTALGEDSGYGFARVGSYGYLRAADPVSTAIMPSYVVHGDMPNEHMPSGEASGTYRNLVSEVEMALHDHEVNLRRQEEGLQPINCLWFWGGGFAPEQKTEPRPPLFADDPLLKGYWLSKTAVAEPWPGNIADCLEQSVAGFVAVVPEDDNPELLGRCLAELRVALQSGRLSRLTLVFRDGIEATLLSKHAWRMWRTSSALLD